MLEPIQTPSESQVNYKHPSKLKHLEPWRLLLLGSSLLVTIISIFQVLPSPRYNPDGMLYASGICIVWLCIFAFCSYGIFRTPYLFTSAYILLLTLFHLGITIPESLGLLKVNNWSAGPFAKWLEYAEWYTILSLSCLGIGFSLSITHKNETTSQGRIEFPNNSKPLRIAFNDGIGLLIVSGIMFGIAILSFGNLLAYTRSDFFEGIGDTRGLGVFLLIFPSASTLLVVGAIKPWEKLIAWAFFIIGFLMIMLSGYRTSALYPLLMGTIVWVKIGRKIPLSYAVIALVGILFFVSVIGILRQTKYEEIDTTKTNKALQEASFTHSLTTMGQTGGLLAHTLRLVPKEDPYRYGIPYINYLKSSIPNVWVRKVESSRSAVTQGGSNKKKLARELGLSDWLAYHLLNPTAFRLGHGVGFTSIAEAYINFGMPGVVSFFITLGYLLGRLDQVNLLWHPQILVFTSTMLWHLMRTVRDDFGNFIKPLVFTYIFIYSWRLLMRLIKSQ